MILLLPPAEGTVIPTRFSAERTQHEYDVLCLWEQDPQLLLNDLALLPLAPLAATSQPEALLRQVANQISQLESEQQRQELLTYTQIFAGLRLISGNGRTALVRTAGSRRLSLILILMGDHDDPNKDTALYT